MKIRPANPPEVMGPTTPYGQDDTPDADMGERLLSERGKYIRMLESEAEAARIRGDHATRIGVLKFLALLATQIEGKAPMKRISARDVVRELASSPLEDERLRNMPIEQLRRLAQ